MSGLPVFPKHLFFEAIKSKPNSRSGHESFIAEERNTAYLLVPSLNEWLLSVPPDALCGWCGDMPIAGW
jgi:hypothetical protein